jgi:hypothetical protein
MKNEDYVEHTCTRCGAYSITYAAVLQPRYDDSMRGTYD